MRCNAKIWGNTGITIGNTNIDFDKEYCVEIKSRVFKGETFKGVGNFFIFDGVSILFKTKDMGFFELERVSNIYEKVRVKEDKTLYSIKKVQMYERYKRSAIR